MFTKFTNKFRQFWAPHGVKAPPPAITETLELGEEFHKLRVRAKANQNSLLEAARDKSRAEKDDAKKEAKKVLYNPLVHSFVKPSFLLVQTQEADFICRGRSVRS